MHPFDLGSLFLPVVVIFTATLIVTYVVTHSSIISPSASLLKAGAFFAYYGLVFDGTYNFADDWVYIDVGRELMESNVGLLNLGENWGLLLSVSEGDHVLYYLYNAYAFRLFGVGYYAPVALNVVLTLFIAWLGTNLATREFHIQSKNAFFLFLLFHPDILAWSNVINGKDIIALFLHISLLYAVAMLLAARVRTATAIAIPAIVALLFVRFYAPLLFAIALATTFFVKGHKRRWLLLFVACSLLGAAVLWIGEDRFRFAMDAMAANFVNPFYGFVRAALTPIPLNTSREYGFLEVTSLIHWLLFPFALYGAFIVYKRGSTFSLFFLFYFLVFVALAAVYEEAQGPRHRVQLDYAWVVFQFVGLQAMIRAVLTSMASAVARRQPNSSVARQDARARPAA